MPGLNNKATNEVLNWMHGLSGFFTKMRSDYGTISQMLEHPDWDENRTEYTKTLMESLAAELTTAAKEIREHVDSKFG
ncbi:MAG: hypothetical protein CMJ78_05000 [Planctomycetaceae bacterium]|nr:hypothetical protein [Planctomycetaceae bacterium]